MTTPTATVRDNEAGRRFEIHLGEGLAGFATYEPRPGALAILHAEIDPAFEGQGLGSVLVRGALDDARKRGLAVLPYCPFVKRWIQLHPEYVDLVPAELRAKFELPAG
jgi:predicted GNAT family acetyltransferase